MKDDEVLEILNEEIEAALKNTIKEKSLRPDQIIIVIVRSI